MSQFERYVTDALEEVKQRQERIETALMGDGANVPGVMLRMDRLEQSEVRRNFVLGSFVTAGIAAGWAWLMGETK